MPQLMRHIGREVIVRDRDGREHRGIMDAVDPPRGVVIRSRSRRRFFPSFLSLPFFLLVEDAYFRDKQLIGARNKPGYTLAYYFWNDTQCCTIYKVD
ncbi:hypothetical protein [Peribacillus sp. SCS-155]|uniref:hypothetical protein n=1 Tax=Peribacillus sedimenti TaxID=3115297 RepID=UPI0039063842